MRKILSGLRFFNKSYQGWWVLASYHHPDSITWRWSITFDGRNAKFCWPKFGPSFSMGKKYFSLSGDFGAWLVLPYIGTFSFNAQKPMWKETHQKEQGK